MGDEPAEEMSATEASVLPLTPRDRRAGNAGGAKAPIELLTEFMEVSHGGDARRALVLARHILSIEPGNALILEYVGVLEEVVELEDGEVEGEEEEAKSSSDDDTDDSDDEGEQEGSEEEAEDSDDGRRSGSDMEDAGEAAEAKGSAIARDAKEDKREGASLRAVPTGVDGSCLDMDPARAAGDGKEAEQHDGLGVLSLDDVLDGRGAGESFRVVREALFTLQREAKAEQESAPSTVDVESERPRPGGGGSRAAGRRAAN